MTTPSRLPGSHGLILRAAIATAILVAVKYLLHLRGLEPISTLPLLTALMGGVVFTLAILLSGVLSDFKESERMVGELSSTLRRLHEDVEVIAMSDDRLARMRAKILDLTRVLNANFARETSWKLREVLRPVRDLDRLVLEAVKAGAPTSPLRTVQSQLHSIVKFAERIEVIIETTFMRAGYYFAGAVVLAVLTALTLTRLEPVGQGLFLYAFAAFLLTGLSLLVWDLDNPFGGQVRISTRQMDKLQRFLEAEAGEHGGGIARSTEATGQAPATPAVPSP
jgi:hypothetical protein